MSFYCLQQKAPQNQENLIKTVHKQTISRLSFVMYRNSFYLTLNCAVLQINNLTTLFPGIFFFVNVQAQIEWGTFPAPSFLHYSYGIVFLALPYLDICFTWIDSCSLSMFYNIFYYAFINRITHPTTSLDSQCKCGSLNINTVMQTSITEPTLSATRVEVFYFYDQWGAPFNCKCISAVSV